ncbi:MAG: RNA methyltransferase [Leptolyngbyaceae cyanobacterium SM2_3_12]|nr:RNA methyltransferase [Leptolyngbyaceae cyanobacterium SM2_3_12]
MSQYRQQYPQLPRHSLVVCAVLVENPMNLGALCRTAEAFRLEALVLKDLALAKDRKFRQVAVTTDQWQPLVACSLNDLPTWLQQQRQQGYTLLALTPHGEAKPLMQTTFPAKTVLVLGRELTGIPASVLALCDQILAIPQYGLVPSLNVQTAAAMAAYEYIRQWGMVHPPLE